MAQLVNFPREFLHLRSLYFNGINIIYFYSFSGEVTYLARKISSTEVTRYESFNNIEFYRFLFKQSSEYYTYTI